MSQKTTAKLWSKIGKSFNITYLLPTQMNNIYLFLNGHQTVKSVLQLTAVKI